MGEVPVTITRAPSEAIFWAAALPMPRVEPVTNTVWSLNVTTSVMNRHELLVVLQIRNEKMADDHVKVFDRSVVPLRIRREQAE